LDKHIWSLVVFGLLAQSGAGIWMTTELILLTPSFAVTQETEQLVRKIYLTVFILLIVSLIISFFHLGYPRHFFHALNNLGSSWLSREILALSLFLWLTSRDILRTKYHRQIFYSGPDAPCRPYFFSSPCQNCTCWKPSPHGIPCTLPGHSCSHPCWPERVSFCLPA